MLQFYRCHEVARAPRAPGVYAWYAVPRIGMADTRDDRMLRLLAERLVELMAPTPLRVELDAPFGVGWQGTAESHLKAMSLLPIEGLGDKGRASLAAALGTAAILCGAPLYVGKAVEQLLPDRLAQHVRALEDAAQGRRVIDPGSFAGRAVAAGFGSESLAVVVVPVTDPDLEPEQMADLISMLERILNQCAQPRLGRR